MANDEIFRQQFALQQEADAVVEDLALEPNLGRLGRPVRTGSSALGLMVGRDIDITVACERLDRTAATAEAARLMTHPDVAQVTYRNDTGRWNVEPDDYPDGHYLQVRYQVPAGERWNLDVWFVDEPDRMPDLEHLRTLAPRLTDETRAAILTIKRAWVGTSEYGRTVHGYDIYRAVLDDGVRTPTDFEAWRAGRRD